MARDPFYEEIVRRLAGPLDPIVFERCVTDLLRADFPALVPVSGGGDAGQDGAIADADGPPFPLIVTTSSDVSRNLRKNLDSYLASGGLRRKAVLATSQALTPRKRRNLERCAQERGFTLVQVYDREAIAQRLYYSPQWCRELLDLSGTPPALSTVPRTLRPLSDNVLVGREDDLEWLESTVGDRLLVGVPGSGKTFVLYQLASKGWGLFVVSDDLGRITEELRANRPAILIVDDAHLSLDVISNLRHLRDHAGFDFSIVASTWPGERDAVAEYLNISGAQIRELLLLDRDEIVEIVKATGLHGPVGLIREIVDQAGGRPGLAVTLALLCLRGELRDVALGDILSRAIQETFKRLVGPEATQVLACFALGGDAGMPLDETARFLGLSRLEMDRVIARLAAGGVIDVRRHFPDRCVVSVHPPPLRYALVRDAFFRTHSTLPYLYLLQVAPDLRQAVLTLIGAHGRGATIPQIELRELLDRCRCGECFAAYAWLGAAEAEWVLKHRPEWSLEVAQAALVRTPLTAIPRLLDLASGDRRPLHSTPSHPLRLIEDWLEDVLPGRGEGPWRRRLLIEAAADWLSKGGDPEVALHAISLGLRPNFELRWLDPGKQITVHIRTGLLTDNELAQVRELWPTALDAAQRVDPVGWRYVIDAIYDWAYPGRWVLADVPVHGSTADLMREQVHCMVTDVARKASEHPAVLQTLRAISDELGLGVEIAVDEEFDTLFPLPDYSDWKAMGERQRRASRELAVKWSKKAPREVVERIRNLMAAAELVPRNRNSQVAVVCHDIAEGVKNPDEWVRELLNRGGVSGEAIYPFLKRAVQIRAAGWEDLAHACLGCPTTRWAAITVVLTSPEASPELTEEAVVAAREDPKRVMMLCLHGDIPERTLLRLLTDDDPGLAFAAAEGEWSSEPEGYVRESLRSAWRRAILRYRGDDYSLGKILKQDVALAHDWLRSRFKSNELLEYFDTSYSFQNALEVLDPEARQCLLRLIPANYEARELLIHLIGNDLGLYAQVLQDKRLQRLHLAPLAPRETKIDEEWVRKAEIAFQFGYEIEAIAEAGLSVSGVFSGDESAIWRELEEAFGALCTHNSPLIREIGERGRALAHQMLERALEAERREAIYGI